MKIQLFDFLYSFPCLKELGLTEGVRPFLPGEEKSQEGHHHSIPVLKGSYKEDGGSLFTRHHMEKARGNGYKLHGKVDVDVGNFLQIIHCNNLPRDMVEFSSLEVFKLQSDQVLDSII